MQAPGHAGGSVAALLADACADGGALRGASLCAALLPAGQLAAALAWAALVAAALRSALSRRRTGVFLLDFACFAPPPECAPAHNLSQLLCDACQSSIKCGMWREQCSAAPASRRRPSALPR
jgi:hypothetical protein